jgi:TrmH family RNA methyltransferase
VTGHQQRFEAARTDPALVVLEGIHALKHALRFGAVVHEVVSPDPDRLDALLADLAPDLRGRLTVEHIEPRAWDALTRGGLPSPALAIADRPDVDLDRVLGRRGRSRVILLDAPTHLGNVGAVVRVAAAAEAAAVVVRGRADPWHPRAVRGGAGLQFALPVGRVDALPATPRPLVAVDPDGLPLGEVSVPADAILAFGSERRGLADDLLATASLRVAIPMRAGVSSLNLATAVAVMAYHDR